MFFIQNFVLFCILTQAVGPDGGLGAGLGAARNAVRTAVRNVGPSTRNMARVAETGTSLNAGNSRTAAQIVKLAPSQAIQPITRAGGISSELIGASKKAVETIKPKTNLATKSHKNSLPGLKERKTAVEQYFEKFHKLNPTEQAADTSLKKDLIKVVDEILAKHKGLSSKIVEQNLENEIRSVMLTKSGKNISNIKFLDNMRFHMTRFKVLFPLTFTAMLLFEMCCGGMGEQFFAAYYASLWRGNGGTVGGVLESLGQVLLRPSFNDQDLFIGVNIYADVMYLKDLAESEGTPFTKYLWNKTVEYFPALQHKVEEPKEITVEERLDLLEELLHEVIDSVKQNSELEKNPEDPFKNFKSFEEFLEQNSKHPIISKSPILQQIKLEAFRSGQRLV